MPLDSLLVVVSRTLLVSGTATALATLVGWSLAIWFARREGPVVNGVRRMVQAFYALPPVVAGLLVFVALSRRDPVAAWAYELTSSRGLLFTVEAMILAQFVLVLPLVWGLSWTALDRVPQGVRDEIALLGGRRVQRSLAWLQEARTGVLAAVAVGLGRALAEVGAVLMVGGNIDGATRVLTTSIVLETQLGHLGSALWLGAALLTLALLVSLVLGRLERPAGPSRGAIDRAGPDVAEGSSSEGSLAERLGVSPARTEGMVVAATALSWSAGGSTILDAIDLEVRAGEFVVLMGASGAGKTSLLRILAGLAAPSAGQVDWWSRDEHGAPPRGRGSIALVQQTPVRLRGSIERNLSLPLRWAGESIDAARATAGRATAALSLPPGTATVHLSVGEAQRLALARALLLEPRLLLLDEFTAHLDGPLVRRLEEALEAWCTAGGAIILSTHNPLQACRLSDRLVILHEGRVIVDRSADGLEEAELPEVAQTLLSGTWAG